MRKPDNVTWCYPNRAFLFGWDFQKYGWDATCFSLFLGPLVLRWHRR